jgi:hypothetical protein
VKSRALAPLVAFFLSVNWRDFRWRTSRKFWLALLNTALLLVAENASQLGVDLGDADGWVQAALVVLTPIVVCLVRNDPADSPVPPADERGRLPKE